MKSYGFICRVKLSRVRGNNSLITVRLGRKRLDYSLSMHEIIFAYWAPENTVGYREPPICCNVTGTLETITWINSYKKYSI